MAQNTLPVFSLVPNIGDCQLTGNIASAKSDGTGTIGTDIFLAFTAGANGAYVSRARINAYATTPTTTTATVIRLFLSTQSSGATTAANTQLIQELAVGAMGAANATGALMPLEVLLNFAVPAGMTVLASIHANLAANSGFQVVIIGGDY
jgi:hypothetical protein